MLNRAVGEALPGVAVSVRQSLARPAYSICGGVARAKIGKCAFPGAPQKIECRGILASGRPCRRVVPAHSAAACMVG